MTVTPKAGVSAQVSVGGTSVLVFAAGGIGGGIIQNPLSDDDQDVTAEVLYVNPCGIVPGGSPGSGNGTTFVLQPGEMWHSIPGQSTATRANATTSGHKFSAVYWLPDMSA
jgi:hypothetical protein